MNKEHECVIGVYQFSDDAQLVTLNELCDIHLRQYNQALYWNQALSANYSPDMDGDVEKEYKEEWRKYCDFRYSTPLTRFTHCPFCGKKLNWKEMKEIIT